MPRFRDAAAVRLRVLLAAALLALAGCTDVGPTGPPPADEFAASGGTPASPADIRAALEAQERHTPALMRIPGVLGTAVGLGPGGRAHVTIFVTRANLPDIPAELDRVPVVREVTGQFIAFADRTLRARPAPLGFSIGHPAITAGTIGARVLDGTGNVFVLSNNHVLANSNGASIGDAVLQPGPYDGGTISDAIGTLTAFYPITFTSTASNTLDAAIARVTNPADLSASTPIDDGYGAPSSTIFGDGNGDGRFDNLAALLNLGVQKYGRTTGHTHGAIVGVNATVDICYEAILGILCVKSARFVNQLIIAPGTFSSGGDSGSLIVTDNIDLSPVALLFAGSTTQTIANRIDLVLSYFDVTIDDGNAAPPTPLVDVAVTGVSGPASLVQGTSGDIVVTIRNTGNQPVTAPFTVALGELPDGTAFTPQVVADLPVGAQVTRTFTWATTATTTLGAHSFTASHDAADAFPDNNSATTTVNVTSEPVAQGMHVADLGQTATSEGGTWTAIVLIRVHDVGHGNLAGAAVTGRWSNGTNGRADCIFPTLDDGICFLSKSGIRTRNASVRFTVTGITLAGQTYIAASNHDEDGDSDGTSIIVLRP